MRLEKEDEELSFNSYYSRDKLLAAEKVVAEDDDDFEFSFNVGEFNGGQMFPVFDGVRQEIISSMHGHDHRHSNNITDSGSSSDELESIIQTRTTTCCVWHRRCKKSQQLQHSSATLKRRWAYSLRGGLLKKRSDEGMNRDNNNNNYIVQKNMMESKAKQQRSHVKDLNKELGDKKRCYLTSAAAAYRKDVVRLFFVNVNYGLYFSEERRQRLRF